MSPIIANNMGDIRRSYNKLVADSQTIVKGDPVLDTAGKISKVAIGAAKIDGFATHAVTTGVVATESARPRVIYETTQPGQQFKGSLKTATATATDTALEGTTAGFIVEDGEYRIDTAAAVKQLIIDKVVEPFAQRLVVFRVLDASSNT